MTIATMPSKKPIAADSGLLGFKLIQGMENDLLGTFGDLSKQGDLVATQILHQSIYVANHPAIVYQILVEQVDKFPRPQRIKDVLGQMIGQGILLTDGDFWLRQRRLVQPAFHHKRIENYATAMVTLTQQLMKTWQNAETRDISADMQRLTLNIVAKTLFDTEGDTAASKIHEVAERLQVEIGKRIRLPFDLGWLPTAANRKYKNDLAILDQIMKDIIAERRLSSEDRGDLLSMLLSAQDADGSRMTDQQVRDEALTLFLAGHDTTSLLMGWTFYQLAKHPEIEAKLHDELDRVLQGRTPTLADLPQLRYTDYLVKETLRLYPSAYFGSRVASEDVNVDGYMIKKGTQVFWLTYWMHRNPRYFADPDQFIPERWENDFEKSLPKCAYVPFAAGPHICIGNTFAMMEGRLLLATIAQKWKLRQTTTETIYAVPHITLYPSKPITMKVEQREAKP